MGRLGAVCGDSCQNVRENEDFGEEEGRRHVCPVLAAGARGDMPSD